MRVMAWVRLREVEIHHADLDVGYTAADWPVAFVTRALAEAVRELPARAAANRPAVDARYRLEASDHGRAWTIELAGDRVVVHEDDSGAADATRVRVGVAICWRGCTAGPRRGKASRWAAATPGRCGYRRGSRIPERPTRSAKCVLGFAHDDDGVPHVPSL